MRPFVLFLLACCTFASACSAQYTTFPPTTCSTCNGEGCGTMGWGLFGNRPRTVTRSYSGPLVQRSVTRSVSPVVAPAPAASYVTSTPSVVASASASYSAASDGRVLTSSGSTVRSIGGVEVVSKEWAMARIAKAEDSAMSYAAMPTCNCDCSALEAKIDKLQESIDKLTPYREPQSSNRHDIEERLAQQAADRAAVMARIGRDGSLAVR